MSETSDVGVPAACGCRVVPFTILGRLSTALKFLVRVTLYEA